MPLNPVVLTDQLIRLDVEGTAARDIPTAAAAWAEVWWSYASGMTYLNPLTLPASKALAVPVFTGLMIPGLAFGPPPVFFGALEGAMRAGWAALGTPVSLLPTFLSIIPAPAPFTPLGLTTVPVGIVAPVKVAVRTLLATLIDSWTRTHLVVQSVPPGVVTLPMV